MLSSLTRRRVAEKVDILEVDRKNSTPGSSIPETTVQSQVVCLLRRKSDDTEDAPVTTKTSTYRCHLIDAVEPKVSQIVRRSNGEKLTILTKPEKVKRYISFDVQHQS